MSAAYRRELAREAVEQRQCSQRQACRFFELNRSTYRYQAMYPSLHILEVEREIVELSQEHPELGSDCERRSESAAPGGRKVRRLVEV